MFETTEVNVREVNYLCLSECVLVIKDIDTLIYSNQTDFSTRVSSDFQAELISGAILCRVLHLDFELTLKTIRTGL